MLARFRMIYVCLHRTAYLLQEHVICHAALISVEVPGRGTVSVSGAPLWQETDGGAHVLTTHVGCIVTCCRHYPAPKVMKNTGLPI